MSRREYDIAGKKRVIINALTITATKEITSAEIQQLSDNGSAYMGLFMVGGGGAGSGDFSKNGHAGGGGSGGVVKIVEDITLRKGMALAIVIGTGGSGGTRNRTAASGGDTSATYNNTTYTAAGGRGGYNSNGNSSSQSNTVIKQFPRIEGSAYGGQGGGWKEKGNVMKYYNTPFSVDLTPPAWTIKGEDGTSNPFDPTDTNMYGSAGGAGYNVYGGYDLSGSCPNSGGTTGGGRGGYGANNAATNRGANATFYGGGGGGGAFSSGHGNSLGGNGYQGIVKIYFYKYV